jgi:hypothetical protein
MRPLVEQEVEVEHPSGLLTLAWQERWVAIVVVLLVLAVLMTLSSIIT